MRTQPERVVLDVAEGVVPSPKPPVRIFIGTEPAQYRAERVFVWSIEQARDPARVYEIYLMKELARFNRSKWTTGFTNYRFAIPHFTNGVGRAIYNDVDQIYLCDPGELFDLDMNNHGFLAISETESSVMLIDCERMANIWEFESACHSPKKTLLAKALALPNLYGPLEPAWNTRDEEYHPDHAKLLHYTTLHTQPWRPFPQYFVYEDHPFADVWLSLEQSADDVGAQVFTKHRPSQRFGQCLTSSQNHLEERNTPATLDIEQEKPCSHLSYSTHKEAITQLIQKVQAKTILDYGPEMRQGSGTICNSSTASSLNEQNFMETVRLTRYNPASTVPSESPEPQYDGVICLNFLDCLPEDDVPWVLDEAFKHARYFIYASIIANPSSHQRPAEKTIVRNKKTLDWWEAQFHATAKRYPHLHWELAIESSSRKTGNNLYFCQGGRFLSGENPRVWVITDDRPGNTTQSLGLADALGWSYEKKPLNFITSRVFHRRRSKNPLPGMTPSSLSLLVPPWPDVVIAAGKRTAAVSRWIGEQRLGRTRLVHLGRKGGQLADSFDLVVTPRYCRLLPHPKRIMTVAPLHQVTAKRLAEARKEFSQLFDSMPSPHVVLLVGGTTPRYTLDAPTAFKMGAEVQAFAQKAGGSVLAVTSRRTGKKAIEALRQALGNSGSIHEWQPEQSKNPYWGYLASADVLVVTGESESMLSEASATGKPLYIYPIPEQSPTLTRRIGEWILTRAHSRPLNNRGTARPQQRLEYFCAWLISEGIVLPPRDLSALHQSLNNSGIAHMFGAAFQTDHRPPFYEANQVAQRVRALLGFDVHHSVNGRTNTVPLMASEASS